MTRIGVLALQGDFREHLKAFRAVGTAAVPVKTEGDLEHAEALVLPGGESTTIGFLLAEHGMLDPIRKRIGGGMPVWGTCAGAILLAREVVGGDVPKLRVLDAVVHRNAYGRQVDSFEEDVAVEGVGNIRGVFIRAPVIEAVGDGVRVLSEQNGRPVAVRQSRILATTFHPELTEDRSLHKYFVEDVCG